MIERIKVFVPQIAFVAALLLGVLMTRAVWLGEVRNAQTEFERAADLAIDRIVTRLQEHVVLLQATRGLFAASEGRVTRESFGRFLATIDIEKDLPGIQGIGYARIIGPAEDEEALGSIFRSYQLETPIYPETKQTRRTPIILIEPATDRNLAALGFDMYSDDIRRAAMDSAMQSGTPQLSGPVQLVQEITDEKQSGFLIYLAHQPDPGRQALGFVYAPFRGSDFATAALSSGPPLPVTLSIHDAALPDIMIHADATPAPQGAMRLERSVPILGRLWVFSVAEADPPPALRRHLGSLLVGVSSFLFAIATAFLATVRQHEAQLARESAASAEREAEYRGLLLQEMKHRIKNHIARIQSIARQSARGASDVRSFTDAFDARLQAMAAVQEILAGTAVPQADLRSILGTELRQSLEADEIARQIDGPQVTLDERQAHAFAMVAHELTTNAMKYGGLSPQGSGLQIRWDVGPGPAGQPRTLTIDWTEEFSHDTSEGIGPAGFGSRLIDASLRGELKGTLTRDFTPGGLHIKIRFPLNPAPDR